MDKDGRLLKETINEYTEVKIPNSEVNAIKVGYSSRNVTQSGPNSKTQFAVAGYSYNSAWVYLSKSVQKDYFSDPQSNVSTSTTYQYNNKSLKPSVMKVETSNLENLVTNYYYPSDFVSEAPYNKMVDSNIVAPVVEQQLSKNGTIQTLIRTNFYSPFPDMYLPRNQVYKTNGYVLDTLIQFHAYDNVGNVLVQSKNRGPKECYIWSYGGNYPIAKIENADYNTVVSVLGGGSEVERVRNLKKPTKEQINTFLGPLRLAISLKEASINTYVFEPLIGLISSIDSKNMTSYYEYDDFQRLKNIKDQNGSIIKNYEYNYLNTVINLYKNVAQSQSFTKQGCPPNQIGTAVTYRVDAGAYTSNISLEDANNKALADINLNGQNYANQNGTCETAPCVGNDQKMINGNCETATRVNTSSPKIGTKYKCTYHYEWSDGSRSQDYTEMNNLPCKID